MSGTLLRRVFGMPLLLATVSLLGLLFALLGDGLWDALSWLALSLPLCAIGWACLRSKT